MDDLKVTEYHGNGHRPKASAAWIDEARMSNIRRIYVERASQSKQSSVLGIMSTLSSVLGKSSCSVCGPNGFGNPPDAATGQITNLAHFLSKPVHTLDLFLPTHGIPAGYSRRLTRHTYQWRMNILARRLS